MAELLVFATTTWQDNLTPGQVNKLTALQKSKYESRLVRGDIVVVKPDGWKWGDQERLPKFIVVKIPGLSEKDAKMYESALEVLVDGKMNPVRSRKYYVPKAFMDNAVANSLDSVTVNLTVFNSTRLAKVI